MHCVHEVWSPHSQGLWVFQDGGHGVDFWKKFVSNWVLLATSQCQDVVFAERGMKEHYNFSWRT